MSFFDVSPEDLIAGSSVVRRNSGSSSAGLSALSGSTGATPVQSAWAMFIERAVPATRALEEVAGELGTALASAAQAYSHTESTTMVSFGGGR